MISYRKALFLLLVGALAGSQSVHADWYTPWTWFRAADNHEADEGVVTNFFKRFFITRQQLEQSVTDHKQYTDKEFATLKEERDGQHTEKMNMLTKLEQRVGGLETKAEGCKQSIATMNDTVTDMQTVKLAAIKKTIDKLYEQDGLRQDKENQLGEQLKKIVALVGAPQPTTIFGDGGQMAHRHD